MSIGGEHGVPGPESPSDPTTTLHWKSLPSGLLIPSGQILFSTLKIIYRANAGTYLRRCYAFQENARETKNQRGDLRSQLVGDALFNALPTGLQSQALPAVALGQRLRASAMQTRGLQQVHVCGDVTQPSLLDSGCAEIPTQLKCHFYLGFGVVVISSSLSGSPPLLLLSHGGAHVSSILHSSEDSSLGRLGDRQRSSPRVASIKIHTLM